MWCSLLGFLLDISLGASLCDWFVLVFVVAHQILFSEGKKKEKEKEFVMNKEDKINKYNWIYSRKHENFILVTNDYDSVLVTLEPPGRCSAAATIGGIKITHPAWLIPYAWRIGHKWDFDTSSGGRSGVGPPHQSRQHAAIIVVGNAILLSWAGKFIIYRLHYCFNSFK